MISTLRRRVGLAALVAAVLLGTAVSSLAAQTTGTVRGRVTAGTTMRPMIGAQVVVVGTNRGTLTNASGEFLIVGVPAGSHTVRVQMLGFSTAERTVSVSGGESASVDFELRESAITLDEVVVTGTPGATTKRALGNTVSTVKADQLTEIAPISTVQQLLSARTPGLTLLSNSGQAGAGSKIRIRGASSLSAGNEPVIFVDGVRITSGTQNGFSTSNGVAQGTSALDFINPNDIESIEVIKGPAAATLYGAEAANGVIQIITKKGRSGQQGVQWEAKTEVGQTDWNLPTPKTYWLCQPAHIANPAIYPGCQGMDPNAPGAQRLITDEPLRKPLECKWTENCQPNALRTGDVLTLNLSARGGGDNYNFFLSGERADEQGIFYNNFSKRTGGRANFGFVPTERLNFNFNLSYTQSHIRMNEANNSSNSILRNAFRGRPADNPDWEVGYRNFSPEISNQYDNQTWMERTVIGLTANYQPFSWLQNRVTVGYDKNDRVNQLFYRIDTTGRRPWGATQATGQIQRFLPVNQVWTVDYAGTATHQISPRLSSALSAGMQLNARRYSAHEVEGQGLVADKLNLVSSAARRLSEQYYSEQNSLGFFLQEQVGWQDRLYGTVALRVDDNSAFGEEFSLVYYPKASLAWVVSEEPFFDLPLINELKLRAAWGTAGNAPEPFSADRTLEPRITTIGDVTVNQIAFDAYGNPNLKAETGQEIEVGFDASLFEGRMGMELTYYNQRTRDALIRVPNPRSVGYGANRISDGSGMNHLINIGEIANRGLEVLFTGTPIATRNVSWDPTLSISTNRNELVSFGRDAEGNAILDELTFGAFASVQRHREGYPLGGYWAVDVRRDANGNPVLNAAGNAIVENSCVWTPSQPGWDASQCQEIYMGPMLPTREIAFANTLTLFGNLRFFANLDYKGGNYQWCAICSVRNRIDLNTWEINNPDATPEQRAVWRSLQTKTHLMPADFVKLREISASYQLPSAVARRVGAERASVTASARNLWMWTRYDNGNSDPEVTFYSRDNFNHLDYASTPMLRRLLLSFNVGF